MGRYDNTKRNQYNSTPRKVFDSYIDRMALKRARDKEDHRNDMKNLFLKLQELDAQLSVVSEILQHHQVVLAELHRLGKHGTEGLE